MGVFVLLAPVDILGKNIRIVMLHSKFKCLGEDEYNVESHRDIIIL